jgi:hypothetical protein
MKSFPSHAERLASLRASLLGPDAAADVSVRERAASGTLDGALGDYARQVQEAPYRITDEQVATLARGATDDVIFEVTVCAAFGAALKRHDAALANLELAYGAPR